MAEREDLEVHLATCPECSGELARYREVLTALSSLRHELEMEPSGLAERVVATVLSPTARLRAAVTSAAHDRRLHVAVASLGGAVLGAGAIALLWWRVARRALGAGGATRVPA